MCGVSYSSQVCAQLSTNEKPISFIMLQKPETKLKPVIMPVLDMEKIMEEDEEDEEYGMPPRFGYPHKVSFDLTNSGTWQTLPSGDKLWLLNIVCPGALSVNFCYDKFWVPEGGKFFIYSKDKNHAIGAFTSRNNKGNREEMRGFATGLVYGNDVILEYYQPKEVATNAVISIEYVVHGYRYIDIGSRDYGDAADCMVNVNCEEGAGWQNEKKAVAMILVNGQRYCTGSLINTTELSQKPYLLTANHCINSYGDASGNNNLDNYSFYWNYEAPSCINDNIEPAFYSTSGAIILANNSYSDFALLRLTEDPINLSNYTPYYLGWDCSGQSGEPGVCIHHPAGDVKKISTVEGQPTSSYWYSSIEDGDSHWRVGWKSTLNGHGMTQGGSSGSPLLNALHKTIGQLHGSNCRNCTNPNGRSKYGKFDVSWTGNGNDSIQRRLNCWLDSLNLGVSTMEGLLIISSDSTITMNQHFYGNIRIINSGRLNIQSEIELMGNSRVIVESGSMLIIDGGVLSNVELDLKPGSTLRIINGGIIETRKGFVAPVGAIVEIEHGEVM